ncbi:hypothetical protein DERP_004033 [Dermatophagoides pteronyssinus]|uniref:Uncharacterized protein n=1 Tax=Dermatophagoides pteronyssinus TaxID=6956 RepID=A0ABQ8J8K8_DERPT|nr:hypothetical protein DERP_004033 [Dermatophagoides pteronyssinus]
MKSFSWLSINDNESIDSSVLRSKSGNLKLSSIKITFPKVSHNHKRNSYGTSNTITSEPAESSLVVVVVDDCLCNECLECLNSCSCCNNVVVPVDDCCCCNDCEGGGGGGGNDINPVVCVIGFTSESFDDTIAAATAAGKSPNVHHLDPLMLDQLEICGGNDGRPLNDESRCAAAAAAFICICFFNICRSVLPGIKLRRLEILDQKENKTNI